MIYTYMHNNIIFPLHLDGESSLEPVGFIAVHVLEKNSKQLRGNFHVHTEPLENEAENVLFVCVCVCASVL